MKKILLGLLAVSASIFSAINMEDPQNETNVFLGSQIGKCKINFRALSKPTDGNVIKYVVFSNSEDKYEGADSILTLPTVVLAQTESDNIMATEANNVYVRKVKSDNSGIEALTDEKVVFTVNFDSKYTGIVDRTVEVTGSKKVSVVPTALMSQADLNGLFSSAEGVLAGATVNTKGEIEKEGKLYKTANNIEFYSEEEGVLKVKMAKNMDFETNKMSQEQIAAVDTIFAQAQAYSAMSISVTIK